jgi:peptidoglycan hydrolase-like protein with peptidoglycan-binding domain
MADEPRLEQGQDGEWVQYLQQTLEHQGFACGAVDGQFGDVLADAVRQFQSDRGLTADGVVDDDMWDALVRGGAGESQVSDERMTSFDMSYFPLLAELAQYQEGEDGVRQFLIARGLDGDFVEAMVAGNY